MKTNPTSRSRLFPFLAFTSALAVAALGLTHAAETPEGKNMMYGKMVAGCEEMMEQKKTMMTSQRAQDTALAARVVAMNAATGGKKSELMAAIVTNLVEQRAAQNVQAGKMQEKMMAHMMEHMEMGKDSMESCPMMKGADEKSMKVHQENDGDKK